MLFRIVGKGEAQAGEHVVSAEEYEMMCEAWEDYSFDCAFGDWAVEPVFAEEDGKLVRQPVEPPAWVLEKEAQEKKDYESFTW